MRGDVQEPDSRCGTSGTSWHVTRINKEGQLTADRKFEREISEKLSRRIELRGSGRPRKSIIF
ncbi:MAG: hypothetical protein D4R73_10515 [Deltaproteobacteria bacterium]|nr:MAG: hypothetical protein D4R73_10515 [Deltaproteobacteria bacterium]